MGGMDAIMLLNNQVMLHDSWKAVRTVSMNGQAERKLMKGRKNYGTDATLSQSTGRQGRSNEKGEKYVTGVMQCAY